MSNQDIDFLTVTPEIRELYQFPTDKTVIESYQRSIKNEALSFRQKFIKLDYFTPIATLTSGFVFILSYVLMKQPAGDVARQYRFERMQPFQRILLKGVPAVSLFATIYFVRQCKPY